MGHPKKPFTQEEAAKYAGMSSIASFMKKKRGRPKITTAESVPIIAVPAKSAIAPSKKAVPPPTIALTKKTHTNWGLAENAEKLRKAVDDWDNMTGGQM